MGEWQRVLAGSRVQFTRGVTWTAERERELPSSSTHRVLRIPNVQADLVLDEVLLVDFPGGVPAKWRATPGTIVMVGSNGNPRRVGNAVQISPGDGDFLFASFLIAAKARSRDLNERYLFHWVKSNTVQDLISRSVQGSTGLSNLSMGFLRGLPLPFPPLKEQRGIAEILDTIDEHIQATERVIAKRGRQLHGLAAYLMGPYAPIGKWEERRLSEWTQPGCPITYGIVQAGPNIPDGIPYIRTGDMAAELRVEGLLRTTPQIAQRYSRSRVSEGDIVYAIRATVGKVLIVPRELDGANLTQGTARIAPGPDADRYCLLWALRSDEISRQIRAVQKGTTFQEITLEQLRSLAVRLPTELADQHQITGPLLATEEVIRAERRTLAKYKKLQSGLTADLLSGRVRTVAA